MGKYKGAGLLERELVCWKGNWSAGKVSLRGYKGWHQPATNIKLFIPTSSQAHLLLIAGEESTWFGYASHSCRLGCDPSHNLTHSQCPSQWMLHATLDQSSILCSAAFEFKLFFCLQSLNRTLLIMKLSEILLNLEFRNYKPLQSADFFFPCKTTFNWIITSSLPFFFCSTGFKNKNKNYSFPYWDDKPLLDTYV